jgi:alpha-D-xyloside xylohydrolase
VQDWSYWPENAWGSHDFDTARFPDPKGMVDSIHALNARIMISVWPKFYHTTANYKAFDKEGWMFNRAVKDSIRDWIGNGYIGGFYDVYSEGARKLFWKQMNEKLYSKGIDAWWMDASEPDILSNASMEYRKALMNPTALGSSTEYFNTYALVNAQAIYEGQRSVNPNERVFLLTRSGFAGLQRYSTATWSGDIGTRWEDMKTQISAGLNFAMSGIPYWTMDIGGFCVERRYEQAKEGSEDLKEWRELNARWFQFGAFCPLFRSHGQYPYREIYNLASEGTPTYNSMVYYTKLRYRMMPYIYSLAGMTYFNDYTIMRALVMDFNADANTYNIGDQYMFGPNLMVCPVYKYKAASRDVYFPSNTNWYDFETGEYITGGKTKTVAAPYERIPLFVKEGSILPMGQEIQSTKEVQTDLTLKVYTGANGEFTLYEDEGVNYNYEKGAYSSIGFSYDEASKTLTIGEIKGEYPDMPKARTFTVEWMVKGKKNTISKVAYSGGKMLVKMAE